MSVLKSVTITIPISALQTWELITNAKKMHGLFIPGVWKEYDREIATKGTIIKKISLGGSEWYDRLIVDFIKPYKFSFGGSHKDREDWTFMYELREIEPNVTELKFSRKFKKLNWYEYLFKRKSTHSEYVRLASTTTDRIKNAAYNISIGQDDGIYPSPY